MQPAQEAVLAEQLRSRRQQRRELRLDLAPRRACSNRAPDHDALRLPRHAAMQPAAAGRHRARREPLRERIERSHNAKGASLLAPLCATLAALSAFWPCVLGGAAALGRRGRRLARRHPPVSASALAAVFFSAGSAFDLARSAGGLAWPRLAFSASIRLMTLPRSGAAAMIGLWPLSFSLDHRHQRGLVAILIGLRIEMRDLLLDQLLGELQHLRVGFDLRDARRNTRPCSRTSRGSRSVVTNMPFSRAPIVTIALAARQHQPGDRHLLGPAIASRSTAKVSSAIAPSGAR